MFFFHYLSFSAHRVNAILNLLLILGILVHHFTHFTLHILTGKFYSFPSWLDIML